MKPKSPRQAAPPSREELSAKRGGARKLQSAPKLPANGKSPRGDKRLDYRSAGVDIEAGNAFADYIFSRVRSTYNKRVIPLDDGYAGLFSIASDPRRDKTTYRKPVLVACTDGVGTKVKVAIDLDRHDTIGIDLVAMSVNDMLCVGATPLFFLDYIGCSRLERRVSRGIISGVIAGCREANCALLGGETAEMPDLYAKGEYDLAGFAVGVVEENAILRGKSVRPGDAIIGLPSSGLHSNGYSLARRALFDAAGLSPRKPMKELGGKRLGDALLEPTRIYVRSILKLLRVKGLRINALAHITGGGLEDNLPRVLPAGCKARIDVKAWPQPPIFDLVRQAGKIETREMYRVFNMGIGFVVIVPDAAKARAMTALRRFGEKPLVIGEVVKGKRGVALMGI